MKKLLIIVALFSLSNVLAQEHLLTRKIIYDVNFTSSSVKSTSTKDTVQYDYLVNKLYFWQANDEIIKQIKNKQTSFKNLKGETLNYDTIINNLCKALNLHYNAKYNKNNIQEVLDNEIRAIKFLEQWTYNPQSMLIDKKVLAFCPVVKRDSVALVDLDLKTKEAFSFELGWIFNTPSTKPKDTILIANNLQYTMNIYNKQPYQWWNQNLEAEFSIPYFEMLFNKAENSQIEVFSQPNSTESLSQPEVIHRRDHTQNISTFELDAQNTEIEKDTIITLKFNSEDIEALRFGEKIIFDKANLRYEKQVNYLSPIIYIFSSNGDYHGMFPIYYIRKK